jgi:hypothetical protein
LAGAAIVPVARNKPSAAPIKTAVFMTTRARACIKFLNTQSKMIASVSLTS